MYTSGRMCERIKQKQAEDNFTLNGKPLESFEQRRNNLIYML